MGAWGTDTFDNDTACDWAYELAETKELKLVEQAIDRVLLVGSGYLDADVATQGLAACEVIARLKGHFGARNAYTETVDTWVAKHQFVPQAGLVTRALSALDRVVADSSELRDLWAESDDDAAWRAAISDLRRRVEA